MDEKKLVLQVNEVFHDLEGEKYHQNHDDIIFGESKRWAEYIKEFIIPIKKDIVLLDIGTGTGFLPLEIGKRLKESDIFVCSDISQNILDAARKNLEGSEAKCKFIFLKVNGEKINLDDNSVDIVTVNSVLHHLPDLERFFLEVDRLIYSGGYLMIGHEPTKKFFETTFLRINYILVSSILYPSKLIYKLLEKLKLLQFVKRFLGNISDKRSSEYAELVKNVNKKLIKRGAIEKPLTTQEITKLIDFRSPTAGGIDAGKGIDMQMFMRENLKNFSIEKYVTYNHISKLSKKNRFTSWYDGLLAKIFPENGATFFAVLRKK